MQFTRRDLLRSGLAAGAALSLAPGLRSLACAADGVDGGLLVVVRRRGACDGLHLISPSSDADFIAARISALRVAADGARAGPALANGLDPQVDFRLQDAAPGLAELYKSGQLAFVPAAGLPAETRSHFVATDMIERGIGDNAALARATSGWLARYQQGLGLLRPRAAAAAAGSPGGAFEASATVLAIPDLGGGFGMPGGPHVAEVLSRMYGAAPGPVAAAGRTALSAMPLGDRRVARDPQNHPQPYVPERNVNYDPAGDLARPLKTVAQLAKMDIGLQVATADIGGWDTHEGQPGRFRNAVGRFSAGLAAFYEDMWRYHDRLLLVTLSEFGRRLRSNRSNGTDHGRPGVMAVLRGHGSVGGVVGA